MEAGMAARTLLLSWRAKSGGPRRWCGSRSFPGPWKFFAKDTAGWRRTAVAPQPSVPRAKVPSSLAEKEAVMPGLLQLLWLAAFVQVAIAFANCFLPARLKYRENLSASRPLFGKFL